jgi:hypothetical protein
MKNFLSKIIVTVLLLYCCFSCKKSYLDRQPQGTLNELTLGTRDGVYGLLIGTYSLLDGQGSPNVGYLGNSDNSAISNWIFGGIASDDAYKGQRYGRNPQQEQIESYNVNAANPSILDKWKACYGGVQRANDVLRVLAKVPSGQISDEESVQFRAEAVFLRGVFHLELVKVFWNIPYVDETITFGADNYKVPNTMPALPKIEEDFQFASKTLTETKPQVGRANKWAAKSFLAKTLIFEEKFAEARNILSDIIANGKTASGLKYDLGRFSDNFNALTKNNAESVFAVQFSVHDGANAINGNYGDILNYPLNTVTRCCGAYKPSFSLVNSYKTDPATGLPLLDNFNDSNIPSDMFLSSSNPFTPYAGTLDSRLDWTVGRRGIPYLDWGVNPGASWSSDHSSGGPYLPIKNAFWAKDKDKTNQPYAWASGYNANNYEMIRFADVLLWAAEAEIEAGTLAQAEVYVNRVRARAADPAGWVKTYVDNANPQAGFTNTPAANYKVGLYTGQFIALGPDFARKAVRFERKLELAMEGHRFFDLRRYDKGTGYMADVLNTYILHDTNYPGWDYVYMENAKFTKGKNELFPIPQSEIDASMKDGKPTLVQNPGYN